MSITATVENDTIKLPVHVPDGTRVEITLPAASAATDDGPTLYDELKDFIGMAQDLPSDMAENLDHYLHGHAKK